MAFDAPKKQQETLRQSAFSGMNELGVSVSRAGRRVIVAVHCHANNDSLYGLESEYEDERYAVDADDEEQGEDEEPGGDTFESEDGVLGLLT
jgi:hypothetical protein